MNIENKMASKGVLMNAFFDQFIAFATELKEMYPNDPDFPLFLTSLRLLRTTNPSMVIGYVNESVGPFQEKILAKDEDFFLKHDYSEYTASVDMNVFDKLKQYISEMSPDSKESVWKYTQNITRLASACK